MGVITLILVLRKQKPGKGGDSPGEPPGDTPAGQQARNLKHEQVAPRGCSGTGAASSGSQRGSPRLRPRPVAGRPVGSHPAARPDEAGARTHAYLQQRAPLRCCLLHFWFFHVASQGCRWHGVREFWRAVNRPGAGELCDPGVITSPLWTSEFSRIKWSSEKCKCRLDSPSLSPSSLIHCSRWPSCLESGGRGARETPSPAAWGRAEPAGKLPRERAWVCVFILHLQQPMYWHTVGVLGVLT